MSCCICFDSNGINDTKKFWNCSAEHTDKICNNCISTLINNDSNCPICRSDLSHKYFTPKNITEYFNNNNINNIRIRETIQNRHTFISIWRDIPEYI